MGLSGGTRLGPYEIVSPLGAGGMGEVYRARDTRLDRTVAVKVLPPHLSSDPELKQRFEREARAISSLQHPNICTLYDVGTQDGVDFLVMECLEGQTLAERLAKGALSLDQVLKIGAEISEALDKAHRQGIIHRDLKPGNIMLTSRGAKLMDFGLAKPVLAFGASAGGVNPSTPTISLAALSSSPSLLTQQGTILGTFQYMAPEILQGREADARSDIFSFGCLLYEMITGRRAFERKSQVSVFAAILEKEPETLRSLQPDAPHALQQVVEICLSKDPENRFASAHDIRLQLQSIATAKPAEVPRQPARFGARELILVIAMLCAILVTGWFAYTRWKLLHTPRQVVSSVLELSAEIETDHGTGMRTSTPGVFALSADGKYLTFVGTVDGTSKLWIRSLDGKTSYAVPGSDGAAAPFWSPDGKSIGFFAQATMKKLAVSTGLITAICPAYLYSGAWGSTDWIVFPGGPGAPMYKVSAQGGAPTVLPATLNGFRASFLPDGRHFLYAEWSNGGSDFRIKVADVYSDKVVDLGIQTSLHATYASGYLVYPIGSDIVAQRFDPDKLRLTSEPDVIVTGGTREAKRIFYYFGEGATFTVSQTGMLVYRGVAGTGASQIRVYSRDGNLQPVQIPAGVTNNPKFSPDGKRIIYDLETGDSRDLWILDLDRHLNSRFTLGDGSFSDPLWSPDGKRIAMTQISRYGAHILIRDTDDARTEALPDVPGLVWARSWSPDGKFLFVDFFQRMPNSSTIRRSIEAISLQDHKTIPLVPEDDFVRRNAVISPDGHWLTYVSNESGREEVYIQPFPGATPRIQISNGGGIQPRWSKDGHQIYYISGSDMITAADLSYSGGMVHPGASHQFFKTNPLYPGGNPFDVSSDGKLFVVDTVNSEQTLTPVHLITNWDAALKK